MEKINKTISLYPGGIINQDGNNMNVTMQGYGSVTPSVVMQEWLSKMTQKEIDEWADSCDKWQKENGHKKFEWKNPTFKKKSFTLNPFKKVWRVEEGDWAEGHFEDFKTLEEAIKYAKKCSNIFVNIKNTITKKDIRVRDMS